MKKIRLVYNGETYSKHLTEFGIKISSQTDALLHAVFISPFVQQINQYPFPGELPFTGGGLLTTEEIQREHKELVQLNMDLFISTCEEANIDYKIDDDTGLTIDELVDHSAFADLILLDARESFGSYSFRDVLTDAHCPVLLVSENATVPQKAILCYDENFSSIYAIKMYSYLFPEWKDIPTYLLSINPKGDNGNRYNGYMDDWLQERFSNLKKVELEGNLQRELAGYIQRDDHDCIVVMGAFGGNAMARIFHRSLANVVLEETSASIFIIHE
jgi:nucleotide-binding universal stress UspA family protein